MKISKLVNSILKTAVYMIDQTAEQVDRASDRASQFADRTSDRVSQFADDTRGALYPKEDHTLRNVLSFAAGIGVGVAAGILLAPSSGAELRSSIGGKVQDITDKVRGKAESYVTGTDQR